MVKVGVLAICFSYETDEDLSFSSVVYDLKKILIHALWLKASVYLLTDFDPFSKPILRQSLRGIEIKQKLILAADDDSSESRSTVNSNIQKISSFIDLVKCEKLLIYYTGHATSDSIIISKKEKITISTIYNRFDPQLTKEICWIIDACDLSGKSLNLPFICTTKGSLLLKDHGVHRIPIVILSADLCELSKITFPTNPEEIKPMGKRSFIDDESGSLFTYVLFPLLTNPEKEEWSSILGTVTEFSDYHSQEPLYIRLYAYFSDASMCRIPWWMKNKKLEKRGNYWIIYR